MTQAATPQTQPPATLEVPGCSVIGSRIGPYAICLELATGGMATVFLARLQTPTQSAKLVALKVMHRHLTARRDYVDMFFDEMRVASRIDHPNVCRVFNFGVAGEAYYCAMEYLCGEPLSAVARRAWARAPTDLQRHTALAVRILADACVGLHAAHTLTGGGGEPLGVVHRDISPENLFVTYGGVTKVLDFGLVTAERQTHHTHSGIIKGKVGYISPEALQREKPDRRADIWSMGVVAWELLTGKRLFREASDLETLAAVQAAPIIAPSVACPGLPADLDVPLLRALSRDPATRQSSAEQLGRELLEAYPAASQVNESDIAQWLTELFGKQRRWKIQVADLAAQLPSGERESLPPVWSADTASERQPTSRSRRWRRLGLAFLIASVQLAIAAVTVISSRALGPPGSASTPEIEKERAATCEPLRNADVPVVLVRSSDLPQNVPDVQRDVERTSRPSPPARAARVSSEPPLSPTWLAAIERPSSSETVAFRCRIGPAADGRCLGTQPQAKHAAR